MSKDQRLMYVPSGCRMVPFDAIQLAGMLLAARASLVIVGDSLMLHTFTWLQCQLEAAGQLDGSCTVLNNSVYDNWTSCRLRADRNSRLIFHRAKNVPLQALPWLSNIVRSDSLSGRDVIIFGFTFDWFATPELVSLMRERDARWPRLVWKGSLPNHWPLRSKSFCVRQCYHGPDLRAQVHLSRRFAWESLHNSTTQQPGVRLLNTLPAVLSRHDEHPALHFWYPLPQVDFHHADCTHYLPRSSVNRFVGTVVHNALHLAFKS